jgi:hypothetical protein
MSSSRIHIAIPNSSAMLTDPQLNLGSLRVGYIKGHFTRTIDTTPSSDTKFGSKLERTIEEHHIEWGKKTLPYNDTITLQEIHDADGPFIITHLIVQWPYEDTVVRQGVPQKVNRIYLHEFKKWPFKPGLFKQLFDRMPSHPLYQLLLREKAKWVKRSGDSESFKRMRDTWLINRPPETVPYKIYELWYGRGAMIIPETVGDLKVRELGCEYKLRG